MSRAPLAQLVERQSHNLKVASSILAGSNPFILLCFYAFSFSHFSHLCRLVLHCACCNDACECVRCSLFAVRCSLFAVRCSLFTAHGKEYLLRVWYTRICVYSWYGARLGQWKVVPLACI